MIKSSVTNDDKENEALKSLLPQFGAGTKSGMEHRKLTREELLLQWKTSKVPINASRLPTAAQSALQKANPNVSKNLPPKADGKSIKRPTVKVYKDRVKNHKDNDGEKLTTTKRKTRASTKSSQESKESQSFADSDQDEAFDPTLLNINPIRNALDALDANVLKHSKFGTDESFSSPETLDPEKSAQKSTPMALLQRALAARNDDLKNLEEKFAREIARADRFQIEIEARKQEAEEARSLTRQLEEIVMQAEYKLLEKDEEIENLQLEMIRKENAWNAKGAARQSAQEGHSQTTLSCVADRKDGGCEGCEVKEENLKAVSELLEIAEREQEELNKALKATKKLLAQNADESQTLAIEHRQLETEFERYKHAMEERIAALSRVNQDLFLEPAQLEHFWGFIDNVSSAASNPDVEERDDPEIPKQRTLPALLSKFERIVSEQNDTIKQLKENQEIAEQELKDYYDVVMELEPKAIALLELEEKYRESVECSEDLRTNLLSTQVSLYKAHADLELAQNEATELRDALEETLVENERVSSAFFALLYLLRWLKVNCYAPRSFVSKGMVWTFRPICRKIFLYKSRKGTQFWTR
ncbi:uncharacterized protein EV422DRAFT_532583 [Fimicolochytrium jonesii]|uniref:uncharacterized protein n=1 Tax=Fimicolochytrium jonesii TaxID=1396493 RepID=UPI0022FE8FB4|nr:uncharacterized protein EV422DRAFT_532583 [Fimicolochytrium jonesii]KAI8819864.1 hypothetical protein EV422DRAFT_532583 [Fimicolochytrium jonesii]